MHVAISYFLSQIVNMKYECIINVLGYTEILPPKLSGIRIAILS